MTEHRHLHVVPKFVPAENEYVPWFKKFSLIMTHFSKLAEESNSEEALAYIASRKEYDAKYISTQLSLEQKPEEINAVLRGNRLDNITELRLLDFICSLHAKNQISETTLMELQNVGVAFKYAGAWFIRDSVEYPDTE